MSNDFLILGKGYCGSKFATKYSTKVTSRTPTLENDIYFELNNINSWKNLPKANCVVWTFACKGDDIESEFFEYLLENISSKIIIYSTSSVYLHEFDEQIIDEKTSIKPDNPRAIKEEQLRSKGASILTLCGIYGPKRNPKNWLLKGLIKDPDKDVNLIHVDDIVSLTHQLSQKDIWGMRINLCPGESDSWNDLAAHYSYQFPANQVSNKKMRKTVKSCLLESILEKSYPFLRVLDLPQDL